jgi:hypothetical protein
MTAPATSTRRRLRPITVTTAFDRIGPAPSRRTRRTPDPLPTLTMQIPAHTTASTDAMAHYLGDAVRDFIRMHLDGTRFTVTIEIAPSGVGTITIDGGTNGTATIEPAP